MFQRFDSMTNFATANAGFSCCATAEKRLYALTDAICLVSVFVISILNRVESLLGVRINNLTNTTVSKAIAYPYS